MFNIIMPRKLEIPTSYGQTGHKDSVSLINNTSAVREILVGSSNITLSIRGVDSNFELQLQVYN